MTLIESFRRFFDIPHAGTPTLPVQGWLCTASKVRLRPYSSRSRTFGARTRLAKLPCRKVFFFAKFHSLTTSECFIFRMLSSYQYSQNTALSIMT